MRKLAKRTNRARTRRRLDLDDIGLALDYFLTPTPIRRIMDVNLFNSPNELAIKEFHQTQALTAINAPSALADLYQEYVKNRLALSDYNDDQVQDDAFAFGVTIAQELGNLDPITGKIVLQNDAEANAFLSYVSLYCYRNGKRYAQDWLEQHPLALNNQNKQVVTALVAARFSVLRIDQKLAHGAIKTVDIISKNSYLLIDKAINATVKEGCFLICSALNMGNYIMTSGSGIPVDGHSRGGKAILTILYP